MIDGIETPVLNLSSFDFLNLSQDPDSKEICKKTLMKYGVGSCGPRGFYGTIDVHLEFEKAIAEHMGVQVYDLILFFLFLFSLLLFYSHLYQSFSF